LSALSVSWDDFTPKKGQFHYLQVTNQMNDNGVLRRGLSRHLTPPSDLRSCSCELIKNESLVWSGFRPGNFRLSTTSRSSLVPPSRKSIRFIIVDRTYFSAITKRVMIPSKRGR
jgi:hypothetical protein